MRLPAITIFRPLHCARAVIELRPSETFRPLHPATPNAALRCLSQVCGSNRNPAFLHGSSSENYMHIILALRDRSAVRPTF
ncbi:hypothetical protein HBI41_247890 [Parastagonospora nodorum]|nr:hypothetical protein HBI41_247890 [Parastagonospora nodorum]